MFWCCGFDGFAKTVDVILYRGVWREPVRGKKVSDEMGYGIHYIPRWMVLVVFLGSK
jgi:hypothetical protein